MGLLGEAGPEVFKGHAPEGVAQSLLASGSERRRHRAPPTPPPAGGPAYLRLSPSGPGATIWLFNASFTASALSSTLPSTALTNGTSGFKNSTESRTSRILSPAAATYGEWAAERDVQAHGPAPDLRDRVPEGVPEAGDHRFAAGYYSWRLRSRPSCAAPPRPLRGLPAGWRPSRRGSFFQLRPESGRAGRPAAARYRSRSTRRRRPPRTLPKSVRRRRPAGRPVPGSGRRPRRRRAKILTWSGIRSPMTRRILDAAASDGSTTPHTLPRKYKSSQFHACLCHPPTTMPPASE